MNVTARINHVLMSCGDNSQIVTSFRLVFRKCVCVYNYYDTFQ